MTSSVTSDVVKGFYALVGFAGLCTAGIYSLIILSKGWSILQGTTARMTSGKAVGYMFIPIFNIYWMFVAYKGLADDANKFVDRQPINNRINPNIALAACIISLIPYFNILAPIFFTILFYQICGFHNEIIDQWEYLSEHPDSDKVGSSNTAVIIIAAVFGSIFIIGILAAIAIPQFSTYRVKGYNAAAISDCKNLKTSLEAYYADHQTYPDDMKRLNYVASKDVEIGYSPNCNSTYNQYTYSAETSCNGYGIAAFHKQGDRIMVANSSKPQIFFKLKSEPDDKYRPL